MKKYRLKKDLPMFKAGEKFEIDEDGNLRSLGFFKEYPSIGQRVGFLVFEKSILEKFPNILTDWFEEIPEGPKTVDDLTPGDSLWLITTSGDIDSTYYSDSPMCIGIISQGNGFVTREAAKRELARRKAKVILERDAKGFRLSRATARLVGSEWWYVVYDLGGVGLTPYCREYQIWGDHIVFATEEDAEASIKAHPNEWKTYLGVEE